MNSKCYDCPRTKEFIDMGGCPNCGAKKLLMNTTTYAATCDICKLTFGIPTIVEGLCWDEEENSKYKITFGTIPSKQQLLDLSKLIGLTATETYHLFLKSLPVHIDNISMVVAYKIRKYFRSTDISITITPPIDQYHLFENCWHI